MSDLIATAMAAADFSFADAMNPTTPTNEAPAAPVETPAEPAAEQPEEAENSIVDSEEGTTETEPTGTDEVEETDAEEDGQTDQASGDPLDLNDDTMVVVDGKSVRFGDAFVPKSVFTQKTQAAAARVAEADEKIAQAEDVIAQGQAFFAKPIQASMQALTEMADATGQPIENVVYRMLHTLNQGGAFTDQDFLRQFGFDRPENPINVLGKAGEEKDRIAELEAQLEAERTQRTAATEQANIIAAYEASAATIATANGLRFASVAEKDEWMGELFSFALEHDLLSDATGKPDLSAAYERLAATKAPAKKAAPAKPAISPERAAAARKVSSKSTAASAATAVAAPKTTSVESAMASSLADLKAAGTWA